MNIYKNILSAKTDQKKLLAVLLDPEKVDIEKLPSFLDKIHKSMVTHIFVGGSTDENQQIETLVNALKKLSKLPVILFPGSSEQVINAADGLLFLSLVSGRNSEYLIGQQIKAAQTLKRNSLEIIPTGYLLIDGGTETAVQRVSKTTPLAQDQLKEIVSTALASEYLGQKLIYLEAGSGAKKPVSTTIIKEVKKQISVPLIVGGGIRNKQQLEQAYIAGADLVVIGTAFELNLNFFDS
ncbi:geranylgeranylglyceryl phosphate synthase [Polaribacter pacificus]|uniref:Geranylgeranylglyceryl phosphate synthase n=1 Tax=Polaribacter pacificus TaxID=1775173 RepID=A0A917MD58_9FLAO|nr:geranylgeranylglyceryl/heptaprenylglyceryl phosphate synthase [Polaribacter pacificus]GGG95161.1 geranylgeranylglyceryl phosphate synthase [Polaribacter pacificus]